MATPSSTRKVKVRRALTKRVYRYDEQGRQRGFTTVPDGFEEATIQLCVDYQALTEWLKDRALNSKAGKATACGGAIEARVKERRRVE